MESITSYVSEQISTQRQLVLESLHNTYIQRCTNWDCSFYDTFRGILPSKIISTGTDPSLTVLVFVIGTEHAYNLLLSHVQDRFIRSLCWNIYDVQRYMLHQTNTTSVQKLVTVLSMDQFVSYIQSYITLGLNYYFPFSTELSDETFKNNNYLTVDTTTTTITTQNGLSLQDWSDASFSCSNLNVTQRFKFKS